MTTKSPLKSKTYAGIAITLLTLFFDWSGVGVSEGDVAEIITKLIELGGLGLAVYGRAVATTKISF